MKSTIVLSIILFTSACAAQQPASTATSKPIPTHTPAPSPTAALLGTVLPQLVLEITNPTSPLRTPYGIAVGPNGRAYINDAGNSRILVFDTAGTLIEEWNQ